MIGKNKSHAREIAKYEQIIFNLKIEIERLKKIIANNQDEHQTEKHLLSQRGNSY